MVVLIVNLTDAPGKSPTQVDIYNKTLDPGAQIRIPADLVTSKIRALEEGGLIAIGSLPPWYLAAKTKKGRPLSAEEKAKRISPPVPAAPPPAPVIVLPATPKEWVKAAEPEVPEDVSFRFEEGSNRKRKG